MITIFNGSTRSLQGTADKRVYIQMDVLMREYLHLFRKYNDLNPFAVFIAIALHTDEYGWSWPSTPMLMTETGLKTDDAISQCVQHLRTIIIEDSPILAHWRAREQGKWGRSYYHIFPNAGGAEYAPAPDLILWSGEKPPPPLPVVVVPVVEVATVGGGGGLLSITTHTQVETEDKDSAEASSAIHIEPIQTSMALDEPAEQPSPLVKKRKPKTPKVKIPRPRDLLFDHLALLCFSVPVGEPAGTCGGEIGKGLAAIKEIEPDVSVSDIDGFMKWWNARGSGDNDIQIGPIGIAKHWRKFRSAKPKWSAPTETLVPVPFRTLADQYYDEHPEIKRPSKDR